MEIQKDLEIKFESSMLRTSEMMEINTGDCRHSKYNGGVLLKTFSKLVLLDDPRITWGLVAKIYGRKLKKGESVKLIQE